jgi:hypothetical protein
MYVIGLRRGVYICIYVYIYKDMGMLSLITYFLQCFSHFVSVSLPLSFFPFSRYNNPLARAQASFHSLLPYSSLLSRRHIYSSSSFFLFNIHNNFPSTKKRMYTNALTALALFGSLASAMPAAANLSARQAKACFVIGNQQLPAETSAIVSQIQGSVTCNNNAKTIDNIPDVTSGDQTFSKINFATSGQAPLAFSLGLFETATPLADSNLEAFQDALNVYHATEAGLRSEGSNQVNNIKAPKFFLQMQISRILTARGQAPTAEAEKVDHLRDKVIQNAGAVGQDIKDKITQLATQLQ